MNQRSPYINAGERFGFWTALESAQGAHDRVLCRCDCGSPEREMRADAVRRGGSCRSCFRSRQAPAPPYVKAGERYNHWITLESAQIGRDLVLCRCDCGTERHVEARRVKCGTGRSCGCAKRPYPLGEFHRRPPLIAAGERYGRLVLLEDAAYSVSHVLCRCDCGTECRVQAQSLRVSDHPQVSCGCFRRENSTAAAAHANTTHGLSGHPFYSIWASIIRRTTNPKDPAYASYGGRGIKIYEPWRTDVAAFVDWMTETLGERPPGTSLDRINNDRGYEPGNLRWATFGEQARNTRNTKKLTQERDALRAQLAAVTQSAKRRPVRQVAPKQEEVLF